MKQIYICTWISHTVHIYIDLDTSYGTLLSRGKKFVVFIFDYWPREVLVIDSIKLFRGSFFLLRVHLDLYGSPRPYFRALARLLRTRFWGISALNGLGLMAFSSSFMALIREIARFFATIERLDL